MRNKSLSYFSIEIVKEYINTATKNITMQRKCMVLEGFTFLFSIQISCFKTVLIILAGMINTHCRKKRHVLIIYIYIYI